MNSRGRQSGERHTRYYSFHALVAIYRIWSYIHSKEYDANVPLDDLVKSALPGCNLRARQRVKSAFAGVLRRRGQDQRKRLGNKVIYHKNDWLYLAKERNLQRGRIIVEQLFPQIFEELKERTPDDGSGDLDSVIRAIERADDKGLLKIIDELKFGKVTGDYLDDVANQIHQLNLFDLNRLWMWMGNASYITEPTMQSGIYFEPSDEHLRLAVALSAVRSRNKGVVFFEKCFHFLFRKVLRNKYVVGLAALLCLSFGALSASGLIRYGYESIMAVYQEKGAYKALEMGISPDSDNLETLTGLAWLYYRAYEYEKARSIVEKIINTESEPRHLARSWYISGLIDFDIESFDSGKLAMERAEAYYHQVNNLKGIRAVLIENVRMERRHGSPELALELANEVIAQFGTSGDLTTLLMKIHYDLGNFDESSKHAATLVESENTKHKLEGMLYKALFLGLSDRYSEGLTQIWEADVIIENTGNENYRIRSELVKAVLGHCIGADASIKIKSIKQWAIENNRKQILLFIQEISSLPCRGL